MYELIEPFASRPAPHTRETVKELWTRPHIAEQMLTFHLSDDTPFASRPSRAIEEIVHALDDELGLAGKRLCDLGCGPGLYASRFAALGASVLGVDISGNSIAYAERQAETTDNQLQYIVADYLRDPLGDDFDVVTLIYFDYCALSTANRALLLAKIRGMLKPGGHLVLDVVHENAFGNLEEALEIESRLMDGFWSPAEYVGVHRTWLYEDQKLSLDHYGIVEEDRSFEILNWMQFFSEERLVGELEAAGFPDTRVYGSLNCEPVSADSQELGVIARRPA